MHDPAYPESLPGAPLVRYTYTEAGELLAVYDRSNTQVRAFTYDAQHPGRMVAHRYAGRPEMRYRYDDRTVMQAGRRCATATTMRGGWWSNLTRQA